MKHAIFPACLAVITGVFGCAPWNTATRTTVRRGDRPIPPAEEAYIESHHSVGQKYGCSFIEFDGKGGFLSFDQYAHARKKLKQLKAKSDVLLIIYCHGWNNNAQSADVLRFMSFLRRMAYSDAIRRKGLRVEGVYLGWRGSQYRPVIAKSDAVADPKLANDFDGQTIVDSRWQLPGPVGTLISPAKYLSYWSIKNRGEFHVSRVPLSRAVFGLAFTLKTPDDAIRGHNHKVFVLGHSFGALVLEQAIGQASVGLLTSEWNWNQQEARWPIDLIVFLNSAAPSLYAKQLKEFLQDDHRKSAKPRIVSLTSTGDWATGTLHEIGNFGNRFAVDLQRKYYPEGHGAPAVTAGEYYARTPGHNPHLIDHAVERIDRISPPDEILTDDDRVFSKNLDRPPSGQSYDLFFARSTKDNRVYAWELKDKYAGRTGVHPSNYWIGTVPRDIIRDHGDIWSDASMEMLAGIYRLTDWLGKQPPSNVQSPVLKQD
jgi:hypothetical protein